MMACCVDGVVLFGPASSASVPSIDRGAASIASGANLLHTIYASCAAALVIEAY